jgi:hypothetical protein
MDQKILSVGVLLTVDLVTKEPSGLVFPWTLVRRSVLLLRASHGLLWTTWERFVPSSGAYVQQWRIVSLDFREWQNI